MDKISSFSHHPHDLGQVSVELNHLRETVNALIEQVNKLKAAAHAHNADDPSTCRVCGSIKADNWYICKDCEIPVRHR